MKYALTLLSLFLVACSQPSPKTVIVIPEKPIDTFRYSVLKFDTARDKDLFGKENKAVDLSAMEIDTIENIIAKKVTEYNNAAAKPYRDSLEKQLNFISTNIVIEYPEKYLKQFIAVINSKGEKEVYVNCFCEDFYKESGNDKSYWRKGLVGVNDGGSCFFQVKIDLATKVIIGFWVNGLG